MIRSLLELTLETAIKSAIHGEVRLLREDAEAILEALQKMGEKEQEPVKPQMIEEFTLKLDNPITEEQWDAITDVDFEHTDRVWFHTKHRYDVEFVKQKWIPVTRALPTPEQAMHPLLVTLSPSYVNVGYYLADIEGDFGWYVDDMLDANVLAWATLPEPWKGESDG